MPEEQNRIQKRQVAFKVAISDLLSGNYVKEEGWNSNYIMLPDGRHISRANVMGVIIDKQMSGDVNDQRVIIDDGSGNIILRTFENNEMLNNINIGDTILVISRPREFGSERYMIPEIIRKIENHDWVLLRKLELEKIKTAIIEKDSKAEIDKPPAEIDTVEEEIIGNDKDIFSLVKSLDSGDGADLNSVIEKLGIADSEKLINNMIKGGELFEIKPGKIKVLE